MRWLSFEKSCWWLQLIAVFVESVALRRATTGRSAGHEAVEPLVVHLAVVLEPARIAFASRRPRCANRATWRNPCSRSAPSSSRHARRCAGTWGCCARCRRRRTAAEESRCAGRLFVSLKKERQPHHRNVLDVENRRPADDRVVRRPLRLARTRSDSRESSRRSSSRSRRSRRPSATPALPDVSSITSREGDVHVPHLAVVDRAAARW